MKGAIASAEAAGRTSEAPLAVPGSWGADAAGEWHGDLADRCARIGIIVLFTFMAVQIAAEFLATGRPTGLLLLASESLVVILTVLRRPSRVVDRSLRARVLTGFSSFGPLALRPASVVPLLEEAFTVGILSMGLAIVIVGKLSLGRSFGLMPANRGIVSTGLYRLVRHPIYLGYLITHFGFVAAYPTLRNMALLVSADVALLYRAAYEERTLQQDPAYRAYQQRVRWRVLPGIF
jgi:protein-S-isoprenylcysteine O-methyltransferase Ste14